MKFGTTFKQGEVILVPVPFTNLKEAKQRPALILSDDSYNLNFEDVIICGITSNLGDDHYSVLLEQKEMEDGNIYFLSRIKVDKLFTVHKSIIKRKLGKVNKSILEKVKKELHKLLL
ncbi:MAG: type II toxin-antitoxin system PemK/MazF family toxin [Candidatus Nanoarchaeia archaeon]|nr:type II toxin-antitoxin system PemK/MazF family toxin [Candidatus Nanoarchaeia archaeon]